MPASGLFIGTLVDLTSFARHAICLAEHRTQSKKLNNSYFVDIRISSCSTPVAAIDPVLTVELLKSATLRAGRAPVSWEDGSLCTREQVSLVQSDPSTDHWSSYDTGVTNEFTLVTFGSIFI